MISEGSGMQADSIAMVKTIPPYPKVEMTAIIQAAIGAKIFSTNPKSLLSRYELPNLLMTIRMLNLYLLQPVPGFLMNHKLHSEQIKFFIHGRYPLNGVDNQPP